MSRAVKVKLLAGVVHVLLGGAIALVSWFGNALLIQLSGNELALQSALMGVVMLMVIAFAYMAGMTLIWAVTLIPVTFIRHRAGRLAGIAAAAALGTVGSYLLLNGSGWQFAFAIPAAQTTALAVVAVLGSLSIWWAAIRTLPARSATNAP